MTWNYGQTSMKLQTDLFTMVNKHIDKEVVSIRTQYGILKKKLFSFIKIRGLLNKRNSKDKL